MKMKKHINTKERKENNENIYKYIFYFQTINKNLKYVINIYK